MIKMTAVNSEKTPSHPNSRWWMSWLLGIAFLAGVIVVVTHFHEEVAVFRMARGIKVSWLALALLLQAGTYFAQGEIWRSVGKKAGIAIPRLLLYQLSLSKLFMDQAIPSAGMSGTVVVAKSLDEKGLPRPAVVAGVVINTTSFFIAYVVALAAALAIVLKTGHATPLIWSATILFMFLGVALTTGMLALTGKRMEWIPQRLRHFRVIESALNDANIADSNLVRHIGLQAIASFFQLLTFFLDAATLWILTRSLGGAASLSDVFASFMIANLFRSVSFIPGGLGTFEAAVVYMLKMTGVSYGVGLAAALLFRGLTFFLPMLPGMWFAHRIHNSSE